MSEILLLQCLKITVEGEDCQTIFWRNNIRVFLTEVYVNALTLMDSKIGRYVLSDSNEKSTCKSAAMDSSRSRSLAVSQVSGMQTLAFA